MLKGKLIGFIGKPNPAVLRLLEEPEDRPNPQRKMSWRDYLPNENR